MFARDQRKRAPFINLKPIEHFGKASIEQNRYPLKSGVSKNAFKVFAA
jgi:hypothetical protein